MAYTKMQEMMDCFVSQNINKKDCYKILNYNLGESLEQDFDQFISKNTQQLFKNQNGSIPYDEAKRNIIFAIEVMESVN